VSSCISIDQLANMESGMGQRDLIPLFCGIFLANQGARDVAGEKEIIVLVCTQLMPKILEVEIGNKLEQKQGLVVLVINFY
jgi:hypothetical protein